MKGVLIKGGQIITAVDIYMSNTLTRYGKISAIGLRAAICNQTHNATSFLIFPSGIDLYTRLKLYFSDTKTFDTVELSTRAKAFGETITIIESALQQSDQSKNALKKQFYFAQTPTFLDFFLDLFVIKITTIFKKLLNIKSILIFKINMTYLCGLMLDTRKSISARISLLKYRK